MKEPFSFELAPRRDPPPPVSSPLRRASCQVHSTIYAPAPSFSVSIGGRLRDSCTAGRVPRFPCGQDSSNLCVRGSSRPPTQPLRSSLPRLPPQREYRLR